ncbi:MAG: hypothetical protein QG657_5874 [Acidobacteriota bacterium]|nr:hypothetical protein [Acidobacteriota bacterium]
MLLIRLFFFSFFFLRKLRSIFLASLRKVEKLRCGIIPVELEVKFQSGLSDLSPDSRTKRDYDFFRLTPYSLILLNKVERAIPRSAAAFS